MPDPQTADLTADAIADSVFNLLTTDPDGALSAKVRADVVEVLGTMPDVSAEGGTTKEHVEAMVKSTVAGLNLEGEIAEMREALSSRPPERGSGSMQGSTADNPLGFFDVNAANSVAVGHQINDNYADFADYIRQVATMNPHVASHRSERLEVMNHSGLVRAALTGEEIQSGGALVPEEYRSQIMMTGLGPMAIRSRATVIPMMSHTLSVPYIRDESHSDGSVYGGVQSYWTESGDEIDESEPDFGQARLTAKLHTLYTEINNTLLADSAVSLPMLLGRLWPMAMRWSEERAFIRGSGAGEPAGVLNASALVDDAGGDLDLAGAASMLSHLYPECFSSAVWHIHPAQWPNLIAMNSGSVQAFMHDLSRPIPTTLLGLPVIWSEHPGGGSTDSVLLGDWRFYLIGDRQAMSMSASEHYKFRSERTAFKSVSRLDGQVWTDTDTTLRDGTHKVSAFVKN